SLGFTLAALPAFSMRGSALLDFQEHGQASTLAHATQKVQDHCRYSEGDHMKMTVRLAVVALVVMLAQGVVRAQGFFGALRGNPLMLLGQESVQKEIKLTDEQKTKIDELRAKSREKMQEIF